MVTRIGSMLNGIGQWRHEVGEDSIPYESFDDDNGHDKDNERIGLYNRSVNQETAIGPQMNPKSANITVGYPAPAIHPPA
jgi:hypothetical protein